MVHRDGSFRGEDFLVHASTTGVQEQSDVVMAIDGWFVVTWTRRDVAAGPGDIYFQRFDTVGQRIGGAVRANNAVTGNQQKPALALGLNGGFLLVWEHTDAASGDMDIRGQFCHQLGQPADATVDVVINKDTAGQQFSPTVSTVGAGNFGVVWVTTDSQRLRARQVDPRGTPLGNENTMLLPGQVGSTHAWPAIACNALGTFAIAWASRHPHPGADRNADQPTGRRLGF